MLIFTTEDISHVPLDGLVTVVFTVDVSTALISMHPATLGQSTLNPPEVISIRLPGTVSTLTEDVINHGDEIAPVPVSV